jgi:putative salt-induced outer membrane protein YdiY
MRARPAVRAPRAAWLRHAAGALLMALPALPPVARAEDKVLGWSDIAEFSYVATGGNSETSTLGLKNALKRTWEKASFELKTGAVRADSTLTTRTVSSAGPPPIVDERSTSDLTAESYALAGRYDREVSKRFFWFGGAGWDRNRFAGIENRTTAVAGVGTIWVDGETTKFRTDYAVTFTRQEDVVTDPAFDDRFLGFRLSSAFRRGFGKAATFGNDVAIDENADETSDLRVDMTNWVAVTMTDRLALKVSLQLLFDNQPALVKADDPGALLPPGVVALVELDELDSVFTASLVVKVK